MDGDGYESNVKTGSHSKSSLHFHSNNTTDVFINILAHYQPPVDGLKQSMSYSYLD